MAQSCSRVLFACNFTGDMNSKTEILIPKEMRQKRGCKETLFMV
jgi:hypothetical protein